MARVIGLGGVFFKARDPQALMDWYRQWLGFEIKPYGCAEFSQVGRPEEAFTVWTPFASDTKYLEPSDKDFMINFVVDDVDGLLEQVRKGGGQVVDEVVREPYGDFGWFLDPEGNKIELWKPTPQNSGK